MATRMMSGGTGYRLDWKGAKVEAEAIAIANRVQVERMRVAEVEAKARLVPGRGLLSGTMKARTHIAPGGFNWASESIKPIPGGGAQLWSPAGIAPALIRGKYVIELGCPQWYSIYYHQKHDPFLRIPFDKAMKGFKRAVEKAWSASFR